MNKNTGIIRKVDELGRIVIPIEIRNSFKIYEKDSLEIYVDGDKIILKKYQNKCVFCENMKKLTNYKGKLICEECIKLLKKM